MTENAKLRKLINYGDKLDSYAYDIAIECPTDEAWYRADNLISSIKFEIQYGSYRTAKASAKKLMKYIPNKKRILNLLNNIINLADEMKGSK